MKHTSSQIQNKVRSMLLGVATGDALGVPYEFMSREDLQIFPAKGMVEYGSHNQPRGTWSDDSALTFCLAEAMAEGYSLQACAKRFVAWQQEAYWSPRGWVFDIGHTTRQSILRLLAILEKGNVQKLDWLRDGALESDNGNGSLMRILPLILEIQGKDFESQFEIIWHNSALTHRHVRAAMACMLYLRLADRLFQGLGKDDAYARARADILELWEEIGFEEEERAWFQRMVQEDIRETDRAAIRGSGYVIESLEASLWAFMQTETYEAAVLAAINLGEDTDTTAAITGGLAGLLYGYEAIPEDWRAALARLEEILELSDRLAERYSQAD